ncbi:MAG: hypothetical protein LBB36_00020 [Fibromonadaceae bacterium]|jgi:hypothetical protein|nr:hypothetical protein [Fibromonadaceae bacterium]
MARPIAETPILTGEDARRFDEAMENLKPASEERKREIRESYEWFKSHATFPMP